MLPEVLRYDFFRDALLASLLTAVACGVLGTFVVVKRMSSISGGLSHAALGGVGLGYYLGFEPFWGAVIFCLLCAAALGIVYLRYQDSLDTLIAVVWSVGMAVGILFIAITPGYAPDLTSYLFGNILLVSPRFVLLAALLDVLVISCVALLFKEFQAVSFDEEFSRVSGVPVDAVFLLLLALIALGVVVLIKVSGVILTISLLTIPAVIARHWSSQLRQMMIMASGICCFCALSGLFLSYYLGSQVALRLPTGPLVILVATGCYLISALLRARVRG